jgi:hypothetical protein
MKLAKSISEKVKALIEGMTNLFFAPSEIEERIQEQKFKAYHYHLIG